MTTLDVHIDHDTVTAAGLSGLLVTPQQAGTGTVIVLGGSEGGFRETDALALARHGFITLALAYFAAPGVPSVLKNIPLEYFTHAIDWLTEHSPNRIGILGGSRGGEAALLVASHDPRIDAVASIAGSGIVTQGIDFELGTLHAILTTPTPAWTLHGEPIDALPNQIPADFTSTLATQKPISLRTTFAALPTDSHDLDRISIPIERSNAEILLIAPQHDAVWNSPTYHAISAHRLETARPTPTWRNIVLADAGHNISGPPTDTAGPTTAPGPGITLELGGTPTATHIAQRTAWTTTINFFTNTLAPTRHSTMNLTDPARS